MGNSVSGIQISELKIGEHVEFQFYGKQTIGQISEITDVSFVVHIRWIDDGEESDIDPMEMAEIVKSQCKPFLFQKGLREAVHEYLNHLRSENSPDRDSKFRHRIFEKALESVLGKSVWFEVNSLRK